MKTLCYALLLSLGLALAGCRDKEDLPGATGPLTLPQTGISRLETAQDLDPLLNQLGPAHYALLGEASHGTAEFYTWRTAISKRLIQEKGFTMIGVEGDWAALYELNRYVKGAGTATSARQVLGRFNRWPTWLWANEEVAELAEWLRSYNQTQPPARQVGVFGLDLYGLVASLESIRRDFTAADSATLAAVRHALDCFEDEQAYGTATLSGTNCAEAVTAVLNAVRRQLPTLPPGNAEAFNAEQNALVAVNAERFYRLGVRNSAQSWNTRDEHMMETVNRLMRLHGAAAKIIVWEHNTHVGDARHTSMAQQGEVNLGQLAREQHGPADVYLVGQSTYQGSVIASQVWGGATTTMAVPAARPSSWEEALHAQEPRNKLILLTGWRSDSRLTQRRGHRAIGVLYYPEQESGNYVLSDVPNRYDALLFIDETHALHPLVPSERAVPANSAALEPAASF